MSWMKTVAVSAALASAALVAAPASALVTFASTIAISNNNIRYVNSGTSSPSQLYSTSTLTPNASSPATIVFGVTDAVAGSLPLAATLSTFQFDALVPTITGLSAGSAFDITGVSGTFSILSNLPVTIGSLTSNVLLTATFTNATLSGVIGAPAITLAGNSTTGTVQFFSDFLDFSQVNNAAFSFTGSATGNLATATGGRLAGFRSTVTPNFSSNPPPNLTVPEPETWAMLVLGFGLVGVSVRRRRRVVVA